MEASRWRKAEGGYLLVFDGGHVGRRPQLVNARLLLAELLFATRDEDLGVRKLLLSFFEPLLSFLHLALAHQDLALPCMGLSQRCVLLPLNVGQLCDGLLRLMAAHVELLHG
jgi:hypothetical protein